MPKPKYQMSKKAKIWYFSFLLLALAIIIFCMVNTSGRDGASGDPKIAAWVHTQYEVEARLKAPSTAKYPWYESRYVQQDGDIFTVTAYVDAQNSFGAQLRQHFCCKLKKIGRRKFQLIEFRFF